MSIASLSSIQESPSRSYPLVSRQSHPNDTVVTVGAARFGGGHFAVIAGPCAVESREQILETAHGVREAGAQMLRGGAYKPRTSPYDFQGLGEGGLELLALAREETGLPIVTEVMDSEDISLVARYADMIQIGTRSMSSFRLLQKVAQTGKPVLLKRGMQASIREWLLSAEYLLANGNDRVVLCERGIRTHDSEFLRNTFDLSAIALGHLETHLPIIADPSHGTGRADLVPTMSLAAVAAGADGLILEVHHNPAEALCDGRQSLSPATFTELCSRLSAYVDLEGKQWSPFCLAG
ncbi:MAG: 3-deoxy-7-phosphoheptulonate synthase [Chloroflexi bacterium]|nr:3-deoxy-7-phosphoheptulonate synthase [Chloroflexota bacterium]